MPRQKLKENAGKKIVRLNAQLPKDMLDEIRDVLETVDHTTLSEFLRGKIRQRLEEESQRKATSSEM